MILKSRTYKGYTIYPCESAERSAYSHNGRWIVQTYHKTRMRDADAYCPHFASLADAKAYINQPIDRG